MINKDKFNSFFKEEISSDKELMFEIYNSFVDLFKEYTAVKFYGNEKEVGSLAHKIKPSCFFFGADDLSEILLTIETRVQENQFDGLSKVFDDSKNIFEQDIDELKHIIQSL